MRGVVKVALVSDTVHFNVDKHCPSARVLAMVMVQAAVLVTLNGLHFLILVELLI